MTTDHYVDRRDAGRRLAARLMHLEGYSILVLALPRGGVPVAQEIALALKAPMQLLLVRKLGAPISEELGIGALVDGQPVQVVLNDALVVRMAISDDHIEAEVARQRAELERRRAIFQGGKGPPDVLERHVVLVDDGVATGSTMMAAIQGMRAGGAYRITVAVPVAAPDAARELAASVDEWICLAEPEGFNAVGDYYENFQQYTDADVSQMLAATPDTDLA